MRDDWGGLIWLAIMIGGGFFLWNRYVSEPDPPPAYRDRREAAKAERTDTYHRTQ